VALPGVDAAEALVVRLKDVVSFSTSAACSSAKVEPSHVLMRPPGTTSEPTLPFVSALAGTTRKSKSARLLRQWQLKCGSSGKGRHVPGISADPAAPAEVRTPYDELLFDLLNIDVRKRLALGR